MMVNKTKTHDHQKLNHKRNREEAVTANLSNLSKKFNVTPSETNQCNNNINLNAGQLEKGHRNRLSIQCINEVITNFSDNFSNYSYHSQVPPIIGLESEYQELRHVLRQSLLPAHMHNSNHQRSKRNPEGFSPKSKTITSYLTRKPSYLSPSSPHKNRNVAALVMGPRGHGKRTLLESVLSSIQQEADRHNLHSQIQSKAYDARGRDTHTKRHFRVVRLNGLLLRNGDDAVAFREIIRQLADIAADEAHCAGHDKNERNIDSKKPQISKNDDNAFCGNGSYQKYDETNTPVEPSEGHGSNYQNSMHMSANVQSSAYLPQIINFQANIASLDDAFQRAYVDSIPILIVLYELDAFITSSSPLNDNGASTAGMSYFLSSYAKSRSLKGNFRNKHPEKQILLYHLLDRVSSHQSNISLVGLTTRLNTVEMFERRVKSRAQGNQCVIYCGHAKTFQVVIKILVSKLTDRHSSSIINSFSNPDESMNIKEINWKKKILSSLREQLQSILGFRMNPDVELQYKNEGNDWDPKIRNILEKNWKMGKDVRWFCNVFFTALSLMMLDFKHQLDEYDGRENEDECLPLLTSEHVLAGLHHMGTGFNPSQKNSHVTFGRLGSTDDFDSTATIQRQNNPINGSDPRMQALLDLPESQVAILLSVKRIQYKKSQTTGKIKEHDNFDSGRRFAAKKCNRGKRKSKPSIVTFQQICEEYNETFAKKQNKFLTSQQLFQAFVHLLECDLIKTAVDRYGTSNKKNSAVLGSSGGILQYEYTGMWTSCPNPTMLQFVPVHVTIDMERELGYALKGGWLDCSTALSEWGMKMNSE